MSDSDGDAQESAQHQKMPEGMSPETRMDITSQAEQRAENRPQIVIQQLPPPRDWVQIIVVALPGIAALIALIFAYGSLKGQLQANTSQLQATNSQLSLEAQGQITDRFNAAVTNLGSSAIDVRIGGIYALQRIMIDSHRDQPAIIEILTAFVRDHSPAAPRPVEFGPVPVPIAHVNVVGGRTVVIPADVQAALTVIGGRNATYDDSAPINLANTNLNGANLGGLNFQGAIFFESDLGGANLTQAKLEGADFEEADLFAALLSQANLVGAQFSAANLAAANLQYAILTNADFGTLNYGILKFDGASLHDADLTGADVIGANFKGADLTKVIGLSSKS